MKSKVNIIGAGFSGLCTAYYLSKKGFKVKVFDRAAEEGGLIHSERKAWGLVESAATSLRATRLLEELCEEIGIELIESKNESKRRYFFRDSRILQWPLGLLESLQFAWSALLFFLRRRTRLPQAFESVWDYSLRNFGEAFTRYVVCTALQGIYGGDGRKLSAKLIFGPLLKRDRVVSAPSFKFKSKLVSPRHGLGSMLKRLREFLEARGVVFEMSRELSLKDLPRDESCVVATSAWDAASILQDLSPESAKELSKIESIALMSVTVQAPHTPLKPGFGILVPRESRLATLGILFNSWIFEDRVPRERLQRLETWILQGDMKNEHEIITLLIRERLALLKSRDRPRFYAIHRWPRALPLYSVGLERVLEASPWKALEESHGVFLIGNYLGAIGLSKILDSASTLADRLERKQTQNALVDQVRNHEGSGTNTSASESQSLSSEPPLEW